MSVPKIGFIAGLSGLANQAYDQAGHNLTMWDVDANYHRGNWDARFELVNTNQATPASPIRRHGFYAQVAYRRAQVDLETVIRTRYFTLLVAEEAMRANAALAELADQVYRLQLKQVRGGEAAGIFGGQVPAGARQGAVPLEERRLDDE